ADGSELGDTVLEHGDGGSALDGLGYHGVATGRLASRLVRQITAALLSRTPRRVNREHADPLANPEAFPCDDGGAGMSSDLWAETTSVGTLRADDLSAPGAVIRYGRYLYRTTGTRIGQGGMGAVFELERRLDGTGPIEPVVGKTFHANYLFQLRNDEVTRR